jgi:hypothetical protein
VLKICTTIDSVNIVVDGFTPLQRADIQADPLTFPVVLRVEDARVHIERTLAAERLRERTLGGVGAVARTVCVYRRA